MDDTIVRFDDQDATAGRLGQLSAALGDLTPELRKAAVYILENPDDVCVSSMREIADVAQVKPNTLVRLARAIGLDGYEEFRRPFIDEVRSGRNGFPDRARWLQSLSKGGKLDRLYADMAAAAIDNVESLFSGSNAKAMKAAADMIIRANCTYVLGVGIANPCARNFAYLAGMALDNVASIPRVGSLPTDDLARAGRRDVLIAMTFKPYRTEVVDAVALALKQGVRVIGISDSPASPILEHARHRFIVPTDSPQFFTSTVGLAAYLETLMAFMIADADDKVIANIENFHQRRHDLGIYWSEGTEQA